MRPRLIESAAAVRRREAFLGSSADRVQRAKSLLRPSPACRPEDSDAVLEVIVRLPLPFLDRVADHGFRVRVARTSLAELYPELPVRRGARSRLGWHAASASFFPSAREVGVVTRGPTLDDDETPPFPAGFFLLRAMGQAVDVAFGRRGQVASARSPAWAAAQAAWVPELGPMLGGSAPMAFAELFARHFVKDRGLLAEAPGVARAFEAVVEAYVAREEARSHAARRLKINWFLRTHVLSNPEIPAAAHPELSRVLDRELGPWERDDAQKHIRGARFRAGALEVDTRFGLERFSLEDGPGAHPSDAALAERGERFLAKFVLNNPRIGAPLRGRLERAIPDLHGPWRAEGFETEVRALAEQRGKLIAKTAGGDAAIELPSEKAREP